MQTRAFQCSESYSIPCSDLQETLLTEQDARQTPSTEAGNISVKIEGIYDHSSAFSISTENLDISSSLTVPSSVDVPASLNVTLKDLKDLKGLCKDADFLHHLEIIDVWEPSKEDIKATFEDIQGENGKTYKICTICSVIVQDSHYKRHWLEHSSIKRFKCTLCGKAFEDRHHWISHMKSHTKILPTILTTKDVG